LEEARDAICRLRETHYFRREVERVSLEEAPGRELAEEIRASEDFPRHPMASFDGYALRTEDSSSYPLRVVRRIYAGDDPREIPPLRPGEAVAIATGAFLPKGADTVLRLEDARLDGDRLYGVPLERGTKVVEAGSSYRKGEIVLRKGQRIRPQEVGMLHGLGLEKVAVYRRPRVAVFSTGDEIQKGRLRDTNGPMILAALREWGCEAEFLGNIPDEPGEVERSLARGGEYDLIVTSGGVSVGEKDYLVRTIEESGTLLFHKVKTRPGKPIAVGVLGETPIFALPGKPTGAFVALEIHLRTYLLGGTFRPTRKAVMGEEIRLSVKDTDALDTLNVVFVQCRNGKAVPMGFEGSPLPLIPPGGLYNVSTIASTLRATLVDGYALLSRDIRRGEEVEVHLF
jgi:molybdenum cofactor synthesis domain-containing protein